MITEIRFLSFVAVGAFLGGAVEDWATGVGERWAAAQEPTAQAVVRRHVEAAGGKAALRNVKHTHMVMTMSMPGSEAVIKMESWTSAPNLSYTRNETPGIGVMEGGYDGTVAWTMSKPLGPMIIPSPPKSMTNPHDAMSGWKTLPLSYIGVREVEGRKYHVVLARSAETGLTTNYFDRATGLLAGMDFERTAGPPGQMTMSFDDYRKFGKRLYATRTTMRMADGKEIVTRIVSVDNDAIDASRYLLPPAIRRLSSKQP